MSMMIRVSIMVMVVITAMTIMIIMLVPRILKVMRILGLGSLLWVRGMPLLKDARGVGRALSAGAMSARLASASAPVFPLPQG